MALDTVRSLLAGLPDSSRVLIVGHAPLSPQDAREAIGPALLDAIVSLHVTPVGGRRELLGWMIDQPETADGQPHLVIEQAPHRLLALAERG